MEKILIVEDDKAIRGNIEIFLSAEGYTVFCAANGLEALKKIENNLPDVIISDIMMPYVDGIELYKRVQQQYGNYLIPFIFLTAKSDLSSIREGLNLGVDDYITKPFEFQDLLTAIKNRSSKKRYYLNQIEDLKSTISKNIPHELRTPLVSIIGYSGYLSHDLDLLPRDEIQQCLSAITMASIRLHSRIEKFLLYNNIESELHSKKFQGNYEIFSYNLIPDEVTAKTHRIANDYKRKNSFNIDLESGCLAIQEEHFHVLLSELIDNAFKFSPDNSEVSVKGEKISDKYEITIIDSGRGLSEHEVSSISSYRQFQRDYYQQVGLGLGLYVSKKIVELNDGSMEINSIPGKGTTVKITFNIYNKQKRSLL